MILKLLFACALAHGAKPMPALQDTWIKARNADPKVMPAPVGFDENDLTPLRTLPTWNAQWDALSLRWGQQLYVALDFIRHGYTHAANNEIKYLLQTLGELNLLFKDDAAGAGLAVGGVGRLVAEKLGEMNEGERRAVESFLEVLTKLADDDSVVIRSGQDGVAKERARCLAQRHVGRVCTFATTSALSTMVVTFFSVIVPVIESPTAFFTIMGASYVAGGWLAKITSSPVPAEPAAGDPNRVGGAVRACGERLLSGPADAARPSLASPSE